MQASSMAVTTSPPKGGEARWLAHGGGSFIESRSRVWLFLSPEGDHVSSFPSPAASRFIHRRPCRSSRRSRRTPPSTSRRCCKPRSVMLRVNGHPPVVREERPTGAFRTNHWPSLPRIGEPRGGRHFYGGPCANPGHGQAIVPSHEGPAAPWGQRKHGGPAAVLAPRV